MAKDDLQNMSDLVMGVFAASQGETLDDCRETWEFGKVLHILGYFDTG